MASLDEQLAALAAMAPTQLRAEWRRVYTIPSHQSSIASADRVLGQWRIAPFWPRSGLVKSSLGPGCDASGRPKRPKARRKSHLVPAYPG
jgi:hypothetical protein